MSTVLTLKLPTYERTLLWVIRVLLAAAVFLPLFIHSAFFFPFVVPKNVAFRIIVEVLLAAYLLLAYRRPEYRPRWTPLLAAVTAFIAISTLTSLTGINVRYSWWGNYERMGGVFYLWHLYAYFLVAVGTLRTAREWHGLLVASVFASLVMALFAFAQRLDVPFLLPSSGGARLTGTIGNATYLAAYLLFHVFFLAYFALRRTAVDLRTFANGFGASVLGGDLFLVGYDLFQRMKVAVWDIPAVPLFNQLAEKWTQGGAKLVAVIVLVNAVTLAAWFLRHQRSAVRALLGGLVAFELAILYWTQTRGAIIGLLAAVLLAGVVSLVWGKARAVRQAAAAVLVLAVALPVFLYLSRESPWVKQNPTLVRLARISVADVTTESRLLTWRASWEGWSENPARFLFGYGQENYYAVFNAHFPSRVFRDLGSQIWFDRAHNIVFDIGVTSGLVGLLAYAAIFGSAGRVLWLQLRRRGDLVTAVTFGGALVGYVVQNLFVFDTLNTNLPFFIIIGFLVALERDLELGWWQRLLARLPRPSLAAPVSAGLVTAAVVLAVLSIYSLNVKVLQANHEIYLALRANDNGYRRERIEHLQRAIAEGVTGRNEARQQLATYVAGLQRDPRVPPEELQRLVRLAVDELRAGVKEDPTNVRNHLFLASVANRLTAVNPSYAQEVLDVLAVAERLSPTRPQIYFEQAQAYFALNQPDEAIRQMLRGLDLSPDVVDSHLDVAIAYLVTRQPAQARAQLAEVRDRLRYRLLLRDYDRLAMVAERVGDYELIVELTLEQITARPSDPKLQIALAQAYAWQGKNAEAAAAAQAVLKLAPNDTQLQEQVQQFLADLKAGKLRRPPAT